MVEYLVRVRHGNLASIGYVPSGYYGGLFLGRLFLAEPTHRFGERRMLLLYSSICFVLQLIFWLVPNMISSIIVFSIMGFLLGPFFAAVSHVIYRQASSEKETNSRSREFLSAREYFQRM